MNVIVSPNNDCAPSVVWNIHIGRAGAKVWPKILLQLAHHTLCLLQGILNMARSSGYCTSWSSCFCSFHLSSS